MGGLDKIQPTEYAEQVAFRQWLDLMKLPYFRVPNETYTKSWRQKRMNTELGVKAGVPDIFICVAGRVVAVEMKRIKGGVVSPHQKEWIETLNEHGLETVVARGASEAIEFIERKLK